MYYKASASEMIAKEETSDPSDPENDEREWIEGSKDRGTPNALP